MEKTDLSDVREVVVDYAAMPPDDQWSFRRGMHASGHLNVSDRFLHSYLMGLSLVRIAGFHAYMIQTFSMPFTLGYCFGSELSAGQKLTIKSLEKNHV